MKKVLILFSAVIFGLALVGCEKKSAATTTATATPVTTGSTTTGSDLSSEITSGESPTSSGDFSVSGDSQNATAEKTYSDNLTTATAAAQTVLKNAAKFCTAYIQIGAGEDVANATQSFFFTSDAQKEWYWEEQFDLLLKKQRHLFAAKSSYKDDIECTTLAPADVKLSYIAAYQRVQETGSLPSGDIVETVITLRDHSWRISFVDSTGQATVKEIDATNAFVSTPSATATAVK